MTNDTSHILSTRRTLLALTAAAAASIVGPISQPAEAESEPASAPVSTQPAPAYTDWSGADPVPVWEEPTAEVGTVEYNLWLGRMFNGVLFNTADPARQAEIAARIVHEDYIQHNLLVAQGRQGILDFMPYLFTVMPDTRFFLHDVIATEDRVITRWTWTGTLTGGDFLTVPASGQKFEMDGIDIWTLKDGMLYEHWDQFDWPRAFAQLGVEGLPAPFLGIAAQQTSR